jgi:hypothetical protein
VLIELIVGLIQLASLDIILQEVAVVGPQHQLGMLVLHLLDVALRVLDRLENVFDPLLIVVFVE